MRWPCLFRAMKLLKFSKENSKIMLTDAANAPKLSPQPTNQIDTMHITTTSNIIGLITVSLIIIACVWDYIHTLQKNYNRVKENYLNLWNKHNNNTDIMTPTMQTELDNLIAQTKGKFFSITFVKNDGTTRVINGKDKYQRLLKGGSDTVRAAGYVPFVNRNTETWASAHKNSVVTFKCGTLVKEVAP